MIFLRVSLFFVVAFSIGCFPDGTRLRSPSECRCLNAIQYGFTDEPPFDGQYVNLRFSEEYNGTELEETIKHLGPSIVVWHELCKDASKREEEKLEEERKRKADRIETWKQKALAANLEERCEIAKTERESLLQRNEKKWFWQTKETPEEWREDCPCMRVFEKDNNYALHDHPCTELECLKIGKPFGDCTNETPFWSSIPEYSFRKVCINELKLKV
jgi:hypothetical protein